MRVPKLPISFHNIVLPVAFVRFPVEPLYLTVAITLVVMPVAGKGLDVFLVDALTILFV